MYLNLGQSGLVPVESVLLDPEVYVESGDVVGLFMSEPLFMASLVDSGSDTICTSATDANTLNCSMTSAHITRRLRVQATVGKF